MYSAYGEFLTLDRIDSAVDGLNKVYLEAKLIRLKAKYPLAPKQYSIEVSTLRRELFDPPPPKSPEDEPEDSEELEQAADYLYWFDLRAKFWAETQVTSQILSMVAPDEVLWKLKNEAKRIQGLRDSALKEQVVREAQRQESSPQLRTAFDLGMSDAEVATLFAFARPDK